MCYDAEYHARKQLKEALHRGAPEDEVKDLWRRLIQIEKDKYALDPLFPEEFDPDFDPDPDFHDPGRFWHIKGFSHPKSVICTDILRPNYELAEWGFIGSWVKSIKEAYDFRKPANNNLNAQSEKIFNPRSAFYHAARNKRCVVRFEAYYEHHDQGKKKYPFRVSHVEGKPLYMAGIYNDNTLIDEETGEEVKKKTFAVLTCGANEVLARIHNNEKMVERAGPRMLVILDEHQIEEYLQPFPGKDADPALLKQFEMDILNLCQPYDEELLSYRSVGRLSGKEYVGNTKAITEEKVWSELDYDLLLQ